MNKSEPSKGPHVKPSDTSYRHSRNKRRPVRQVNAWDQAWLVMRQGNRRGKVIKGFVFETWYFILP